MLFRSELAKALSNRSACKLLTRDVRGAVDDARQCVKLNGAWPKGWYRLGRALLESGRAPEAEAALVGKTMGPDAWRAAGEAAVADAVPLDMNGYKLHLVKGVLFRALESLV